MADSRCVLVDLDSFILINSVKAQMYDEQVIIIATRRYQLYRCRDDIKSPSFAALIRDIYNFSPSDKTDVASP